MSGLNAPWLVLMYHRVNILEPDPWTLCVSPEHFAEHLEVLRSLPIRTEITFDDGYADNFQNAWPLLQKHDRSATIFVTSGAIDSPHEMWWDELDRRFLQETSPDWDQYWEVFHLTRKGGFEVYRERPIARPERRMMTSVEVARLAAGGLITIGAHTVTHPVLSSLDAEQQRWEIVQSKRDLEAMIGKRVSYFAYPNGFKVDYSEDTVRIVKDAGFTRAYAAWEAPLNESFDYYEIPRVMVRDWDGDTFEALIHDKLAH